MPSSGCAHQPSRAAHRALDVSHVRSIARVLALALRTTEFLFYHLLISLVDRVNRLPRDGVMPEAMRLYRENIALKAHSTQAAPRRSSRRSRRCATGWSPSGSSPRETFRA